MCQIFEEVEREDDHIQARAAFQGSEEDKKDSDELEIGEGVENLSDYTSSD